MALTKGSTIVVTNYEGTCGVCRGHISAWVLRLQYIGPAEASGSKEFSILNPIQCPSCFNLIGHVVLYDTEFMDHYPQDSAKWN